MNEGAGSKSPKTLADVSHLFFSRQTEHAENQADAAGGTADPAGRAGTEGSDVAPPATGGSPPSAGSVAAAGESAGADPRPPTHVFLVTGGDDAPGKSTVAVNLAQALAPFGRVALFDADPSVPNVRYYVGLPSWHYLSPLTAPDETAPNALTEAGVIMVDWTGKVESGGELAPQGVIHVDVPEGEREPVDFAVVDVPASRRGVLRRFIGPSTTYVVTARPNRPGFERAYATLRTLGRECGAHRACLVVNHATDSDSAGTFHAKIRTAAERLLSMEVDLIGTVPDEPGLGARQRERGAIVTSRPDAESAMALKRIATAALEMIERDSGSGGVPAPGGRTEE
jgi:MinD-like ATPase involved in chromosome partitioning or flagellar assembly